MVSASNHLDGRRVAPAAVDQQSAIDELEKIWEAVIPFHALLARELADQTKITQSLTPSPADAKTETHEAALSKDATTEAKKPSSKGKAANSAAPSIGSQREDLEPLTEIQQQTLRRTQLLKPKAEAELERQEKNEASGAQGQQKPEPIPKQSNPPDAGAGKPKPVDPKEIKAGYQKAIELAPKAVEQMDRALKALKQKHSQAAYPPAEEARKILEEIQKAQPKKEQQDQKQQDQNKKNDDQQKQDEKEQKKKDEQKKEQEKKDEREKQKEEKKEQEKKDQEQKKQADQKKSEDEKKDQKQSLPQVSRDQIEETMRKVRERQQEKTAK
jgi:hypothetical protein